MKLKYYVVKKKEFKRTNTGTLYFVENGRALVLDLLCSREAVSQYLEKGTTRQGLRGDRRKPHTMTTKTENSSESTQKGNKRCNETTCPVCSENMILKITNITSNRC